MAMLFPLGALCVTQEIAARLSLPDIYSLIARHVGGDWGVVDPKDAAANEEALRHGLRIVSLYGILARKDESIDVFIITEADRSLTTVMLRSEH